VAAIIALDASAKFYWALGGTWAGEPPLSGRDKIGNAVIALVGLMYAGILLVRAGYWREHVPSAVTRVADRGAWLIVLLPLGGALNAIAGTTGPDALSGLGNLVIAALAFVVVRSKPPPSPTARAAPTPSGRASRRGPAH
jgi:hypothetical protein